MQSKALTAIFIITLGSKLKAQEDGDNYPPIQEEWRCLEDSSRNSLTRWTMLDVIQSTHLMQDEDCPVVTDEICEDADFYPYPCNCHAYVRCVPTEIPGYYRPCIYKCEPYELIFDPNTGSCVYPDGAPPGVCLGTPSSTLTPPGTDGTTPTMSPTPTVTHTTSEHTTTTSTTTSTIESTTSTTTTTEPLITGNPDDCEYDGQTFPYPADCHLYYVCLPDGSGGYDTVVFDCGDLVFDPNTGACVNDPCSDLCPPEPGCF